MQAVPQRQPYLHQPYESDINRLMETLFWAPKRKHGCVHLLC
jgi:hypothetical protein